MTSPLQFRREGHRVHAENGLVRLDFDTRTEFPWFNHVWLAPHVGAPYERWCCFGVEGMPAPSEIFAELGEDALAGAPAEEERGTVWLMGHDYKVKVLQHDEERLVVQATYPPPMVVVGELSALGGAGDDASTASRPALASFPDWPAEYWHDVETMQHGLQAVWTLERGRPYVDLQVIPVLGDFVAVLPILVHGGSGHPWTPQCAFAGGRFRHACSPDGSHVSYLELAAQGRLEEFQLPLADQRFFLFFGEEERSTALGIALGEAHPAGLLHLGINECAADPANPNGHFAAAAARGDWRPNRHFGLGFLDQTLFLEATPGRPVPRVRYYFYPRSPLPYGDAGAVRRWTEERPEIVEFLRRPPAGG